MKKGIKLKRDELKTAITAAFATFPVKMKEKEQALVDSITCFAAAREARLAVTLDRFFMLERDLSFIASHSGNSTLEFFVNDQLTLVS